MSHPERRSATDCVVNPSSAASYLTQHVNTLVFISAWSREIKPLMTVCVRQTHVQVYHLLKSLRSWITNSGRLLSTGTRTLVVRMCGVGREWWWHHPSESTTLRSPHSCDLYLSSAELSVELYRNTSHNITQRLIAAVMRSLHQNISDHEEDEPEELNEQLEPKRERKSVRLCWFSVVVLFHSQFFIPVAHMSFHLEELHVLVLMVSFSCLFCLWL